MRCVLFCCAQRAFALRTTNLSLPLGEMSRSDREGRNQQTWLFKFALIRICQCVALSVICWRKCQLSQGESREADADCTHAASGELLRRSACVLLLPSRLAPCHLPQGGRLWVSAQPKLVSPSGRDVAQRQRGQEPADMAFQICPDSNLPVCCPLSHLLAQMPALPKGEPRSQCGLHTCRIRRTLAQTCPRIAPSVTVSAQRQRWLILLHASGCLAVSPMSQNTVRNTAAMSAESVMPL